MKHHKLITAFALFSMSFGVARASDVAAGDKTLMLVPVQETAVSLALDMVKMRQAQVVTYQKIPGTQTVALHAWNSGVRDWVRCSITDLTDGTLFTQSPARTIVWGTEPMIPADLKRAIPSLPSVTRIEAINVVEVVNTLNTYHQFRSSEWEWLSRRYDFTLNDKNAEKRRWGRYGPPTRIRASSAERERPMVLAEESEVMAPPAELESLAEPTPVHVEVKPVVQQKMVVPAVQSRQSAKATVVGELPENK